MGAYEFVVDYEESGKPAGEDGMIPQEKESGGLSDT